MFARARRNRTPLMSDEPSADGLFTLAERALMLAGVVLLVVALVMASPLGFLLNFDGDDGDEAAAAGTPTSAPEDGTHGTEPAATESPGDSAPSSTDAAGTPTMMGPSVESSTPSEESTSSPTGEPSPTPTEEPSPTPTQTDDGPGIGPGPPGQADD